MTSPLDVSPFDHIAPEHFETLLGVSSAMAENLISNRFLRPLIEARLRSSLSPLPNKPTDLHNLFKFLSMSSPEERSGLSRYLCVLMNHEAVRNTTSGELLRSLVDWCGNEKIIHPLGSETFPALRGFEVLSSATLENMDLYAAQVDAWLVGSLPEAYRQRFNLRFPPSEQPGSLPLPGDESDREAFLQMALNAYSLMKQRRRACSA